MASRKVVSDVDTNFVQSYHIGKEIFKLLHLCWAQILPPSGTRISYEGERLIVLTQMRLLVVRPKTFGAKRFAEKEFLLTELASARIRSLNNFSELTFFFKEEELIIVTSLRKDCEKLTAGVSETVNILKQVIPYYKAPHIDCAAEFSEQLAEAGEQDNIEKIKFSYSLHCALAQNSSQECILLNLVAAVESGNNTFEPFEMLDGARDRRNDINIIVNSIQTVDCFCSLKVADCAIRPDTLREMGKLIMINNSILDVEFPNCRLSKDSFSYFTKPLKGVGNLPIKRPPLRLLNLMKNPLGHIGDSLECLSNVGVDCLVLSDCKINKRAFANCVMPLLMTESWLSEGGLRVLNLSQNELGMQGSQKLLPFLRSTHCLEELGLAGTRAELTIILQTIKKNRICSLGKLTVLNISKNKLTPFAAVALAEILEESHSIRRVTLHETGLDKGTFEHIMNKISKNTTGAEIEIDVSENKMSAFAGSVFESINKIGNGLVGLTMAKNSLGECKEFEAITNCLHTASNLRSLNLDFNFRANKRALHCKKMQALADCVLELKNLEVFSVMGEKVYQKMALQGAELVPLVNLLSEHKSLKVLNLAGNRLNDEGSRALANSLAVNTTLRKIDIEQNKLSFENFKIIVGGIREFSALQGTLPRETLNRLYHEKKRNRQAIKAIGVRLSKIFASNFRKEQERFIVDEKSEISEEPESSPPLVEIRADKKLLNIRNRRHGNSLGCRSYVDDSILTGSVHELSSADLAREFNLRNMFYPIETPGVSEEIKNEPANLQIDPHSMLNVHAELLDHSSDFKVPRVVEGTAVYEKDSRIDSSFSDEGRPCREDWLLVKASPAGVFSPSERKNYSSHLATNFMPPSQLLPSVPIVKENEEVICFDRYSSVKLRTDKSEQKEKAQSGISLLLRKLSASADESIKTESKRSSAEEISPMDLQTEIKEQRGEKSPSLANQTKPRSTNTSSKNIIIYKSTPGGPAALNYKSPKRKSSRTKGSLGAQVSHPAPPPLPSGQVAARPKDIKSLRSRGSFRHARKSQSSRSLFKSSPNKIPRVRETETLSIKTEYVLVDKQSKPVTHSDQLAFPGKRRKIKRKGVSSRVAKFEGIGVMGAARRPRKGKPEVGKLKINSSSIPIMGMRPSAESILQNKLVEEDKKDFEDENKVDVSNMIASRARIGEGKSRRRRRKKKIRISGIQDL